MDRRRQRRTHAPGRPRPPVDRRELITTEHAGHVLGRCEPHAAPAVPGRARESLPPAVASDEPASGPA